MSLEVDNSDEAQILSHAGGALDAVDSRTALVLLWPITISHDYYIMLPDWFVSLHYDKIREITSVGKWEVGWG